MKAKVEVKFPCGFEYKTSIESGLFGDVDFDSDMPDKCPLHGKKCQTKR